MRIYCIIYAYTDTARLSRVYSTHMAYQYLFASNNVVLLSICVFAAQKVDGPKYE